MRQLTFIVAILACNAIPVRAQTASADAEPWKFDRIELSDGRVLLGLLEAESEDFLQLLEVRRPPGKPMFCVGRSLAQSNIKSLQRLGDTDRDLLLKRLDVFIKRRAEAEKRVWALSLIALPDELRARYFFPGERRTDGQPAVWFTVESTADEEMTRRAVVRVEQMFATFRRQFPARTEPAKPPRFLLLGTMDEYAEHLRQVNLRVKNPAYYSAERNEVAAGSDLTRFAEQLASTRRRHEEVRIQYASVNKQVEDALREKSRELDQLGVPLDQRNNILRATRGNWERLQKQLDNQIKQAERLNAGMFDEVAGEMFARLSHEAFHAYLDNYLFPRGAASVPPWLNEGLAQLFESGMWEGSSFRIDAPHPRLLKRLQAELQGASPPALADLLAADSREFLVGHGEDGAAAAKNYALAWGLAYDLLIESPRLSSTSISGYVAANNRLNPVERLEKLIGQPLDKFEPAWRERMLKLK